MESKIAKLKQNEEELNFNQRFLNGLLDFVKKDENPQIVSHDKRASVCLILRVLPSSNNIQLSEKYQNLLTNPYSRREEIFTAFCQEDWVISGEIQLLYIKRNFNLEDAKYNSGHVAFPGGKHESGETDQQTATREVHEEIGLELHDRKKFIFIGRLFDLPVYGPNAKVDFVVTSFIYIQAVPETAILTLSVREILAFRWIPLQYFYGKTYREEYISFHFFSNHIFFGHWIQHALGVCQHIFRSIPLPISHNFSLDINEDTNGNFLFSLWGISLSMTNAFLHKMGFPIVARSYVGFNNRLINFFIYLYYYFKKQFYQATNSKRKENKLLSKL